MKNTNRVFLVLNRAYLEGLYVDSAWTTKAGADQRCVDLRASTNAFEVQKHLLLDVLEIRLDVMGVPVTIVAPAAEKSSAGFGPVREKAANGPVEKLR